MSFRTEARSRLATEIAGRNLTVFNSPIARRDLAAFYSAVLDERNSSAPIIHRQRVLSLTKSKTTLDGTPSRQPFRTALGLHRVARFGA